MPEHKLSDSIADRAMAIAPYIPPGPFSMGRFLDHAVGLNALDHVDEVDAILAHLTDQGVIVKLGPNTALWILA